MNRKVFLVAGILILLGTLSHLYVGVNSKIWGDEVLSIFLANGYNYKELLLLKAEVIHPPLYYVITKLLYAKYSSYLVLRVLNFILFTFTTLFFYKTLKELKMSDRYIGIFLLIWSFSPYILRFSYSIRMYALAMLFMSLSMYVFIKRQTTTAKYNKVLQIAIDILGILSVYGYVYWLAFKATYTITDIIIAKINKRKHKVWDTINNTTILVLAVLCIALITFANKNEIVSNRIAWLPEQNILLPFTTLSTLLGWNNFKLMEGLASTNQYTTLSGYLGVAVATTFLVFGLKEIIGIAAKNASEREPEYLFALIALFIPAFLLALTGMFLLADINLFHIRQLFPVDILSLMLVSNIIETLTIRIRFIGVLALISILAAYTLYIWNNHIIKDQAYIYCTSCEHFQKYPTLKQYANLEDSLFTFEYCGAKSFNNAGPKCIEKYLVLMKDYDEIKKDLKKDNIKEFILRDTFFSKDETSGAVVFPEYECTSEAFVYLHCKSKSIQSD